MTFDSIEEDSYGNVVGICGPDSQIQLSPADVCPRAELLARAPGLMATYGIRLSDLSDGLKEGLAGHSVTAPVQA
jgi:hypothetical protein